MVQIVDRSVIDNDTRETIPMVKLTLRGMALVVLGAGANNLPHFPAHFFDGKCLVRESYIVCNYEAPARFHFFFPAINPEILI
jgi:hypothetical protein